jgi:hypothetical protein
VVVVLARKVNGRDGNPMPSCPTEPTTHTCLAVAGCLAFLMPARAHAPLVVAGPRARRRNVTTAANPTNGPTGRLDPINRSPASLPVRNLPCPADDDRNQQPVARSRSEEASDWLEGQPVSQGIDRAGIDGAL